MCVLSGIMVGILTGLSLTILSQDLLILLTFHMLRGDLGLFSLRSLGMILVEVGG
jgi:hypothetical protein